MSAPIGAIAFLWDCKSPRLPSIKVERIVQRPSSKYRRLGVEDLRHVSAEMADADK